MLDSQIQDSHKLVMQFRSALARKTIGLCAWVDASHKERFICVDVSYPRDEGLI